MIGIHAVWIVSGGPWIYPMLEEIAKLCEVDVIVPEVGGKRHYKEDAQGISFYHVPIDSERNSLKEKDANKLLSIIRRLEPDIIHIHGTEINHGQIQNFIDDIPVVISIQGLLHGCLKYNTAFISKKEIFPYMSLKNHLNRGGLYQADRVCHKGVEEYEKDILKNGKYFFGRTLWDKAHLAMINPNAYYFVGEELLRSPFYEKQGSWSCEKCDNFSIFMPSGFNPLKGLHFAIETISLLKKQYPDVKLKVPGMPIEMLKRKGLKKVLMGDDYLEYVKCLINKYDLEENIVFLPRLNADEMVNEMLASRVFLSPSTIDNSSNAIGEATLLGMPIVVSSVGGVMFFMENEHNCLMAPSGDEYVMAYQIKRLFDNVELSNRIAYNAFELGKKRHNKLASAQMYVESYKTIIELHNQKR